MAFLQQIAQLMSGTPSNVVYHLLTLLLLQVVFGLSWSAWRHSDSPVLRRVVGASGLIFGLRFLLFGVSLQNEAVSWLPPLRMGIHTLTVLFFTWSLLPRTPLIRRVTNPIVAILTIFSVALLIFFAQRWVSMEVALPYAESTQARTWLAMQGGILLAGLGLVLSNGRSRATLAPIMLLLFLGAQVGQWFYPFPLLTNNTFYWLRLGQLIAFSLWAVWVYRYNMAYWLAQTAPDTHLVSQAHVLDWASRLFGAEELEDKIREAIQMTDFLLDASFVGIAIPSANNELHLHLTTNVPQATHDEPQSWNLNLNDWPAFRLARERGYLVELLPDGIGARQLHSLYHEIGLAMQGAMLVQPLIHEAEGWIGFLLVGRDRLWSEADRATVQALSDYVAHWIHHARQMQEMALRTAVLPPPVAPNMARLIRLEDENETLKTELNTVQAKLTQSETREAALHRQVRDLASTLQELERVQSPLSSPPVVEESITPTPRPVQPQLVSTTVVDVAQTVDSAIETLLPQLQEKGVRLDMRLADALSPVGVASTVLQQILVTLLITAAEATAADGRVVLQVTEETAVVSPLAPSLDTIQFCIQTETTQPLRSTSQLKQTNQLIRQYGGRIWVESETGQGQSFFVAFPVVNR